MKSIFKKIAFVLALAMVVSAFPAQTAAAAGKPYVKATKTLYIGSDANEQYSDGAWVPARNKTGYTMTFKVADPEIVTVSKRGYLTAISAGKTDVTVTFSKDGAKDVVDTCTVIVKKNAVAASIDADSVKAISELKVGDEVNVKAVLVDADGSVEGVTDKARFYSKNKDVFTVDYKTGKLTAVAEGTGKLYVYGVQWDWNTETGKWATTTTTKWTGYDVTVKASGLVEAKQVSPDSVVITCGDEATAKAVAANASKFKATYTLNGNEITTYVKSIAVDSSNAKAVKVTLYSALVKDVVYNFSYDGGEAVSVKGTDLDAIASIRIVTTQAKVNTETEIKVEFLNAEGIVVNQGNAVNLYFTADPSNDYSVYGNKIYFYNAGKSATVKATYEMGYDKNGNKIPNLTAEGVIISLNAYTTENINGFALVDAPFSGDPGASNISYSNAVLNVVKGETKQLLGKYTANLYEGYPTTFYTAGNQKTEAGVSFKFVSTNDAIVLVDQTTGILHPVAAGDAQVLVYKVVGTTEAVIGVASVHVNANREMVTFTATANKNLLSDTGSHQDFDSVKIVVSAKDQLGAAFTPDKVNVKLLENVAGVTVKSLNNNYVDTEINSLGVDLMPYSVGWQEDGYRIVVDTAKTTVSTVHIAIKAIQYYPYVEKTQIVTLSVKHAGNIATYSLNLSNSEIDMNLPAIKDSWGTVNKLSSTISLTATDAQGFYVGKIAMTPNTPNPVSAGAFSYQVKKGNDVVTIANDTFSAVTVSGTAITKKPGVAGTYTVSVYKGIGDANKAQLISTRTINVKDTTVAPVVTLKQTKVAAVAKDVVLAKLQSMYADGNLVISRGGNAIASWTNTIKISDVKLVDRAEKDRVFVESITVVESYGNNLGMTFEYQIPVGQVFYVEQ